MKCIKEGSHVFSAILTYIELAMLLLNYIMNTKDHLLFQTGIVYVYSTWFSPFN